MAHGSAYYERFGIMKEMQTQRMRAEDARRQALKGLAEAKKNNPAMRDRIERAESMLSDPDFCRVPIRAYGSAFREFQAQADASCAALLSRVTNAVASAVGPADFDNILSRLYDWEDARSSYETIKRYVENNEGGTTIMTSEIKNNLISLISQTADDIASFDKLSCDYAGTDAGSVQDTIDRLLQIKDTIADTEIPNTAATYDLYQQIRAELDKIRSSVAKDYGYDIDNNLNRVAEKAEKLTDMARSGELTRSRAVKGADLGEPYPNTATIEVGKADPDKLDELDAGIVIYKTFNQADSIINKMYDNAVNIMFGIKGLNEDHQLKTLQEKGEKLYKQLKEARTDAQRNIISSQLRNVTKQMENRQAHNEANIKKLSEYYAVTGQSYNELAAYVESLRDYFIPLPGQYRLTLKNYQQYLKKVQDNINYVRPKKLFSRRKDNVVINSIADIVELYQKALADHDNDTIDIIKTAIDVNVTGVQKKLPRLDVPGEPEPEKREKTPEEIEKERQEMEQWGKMFGEPEKEPEKNPLDEFAQFGGGAPEEPEKEPEKEQEPENQIPDEDEINSILREVEMMKNGG
ncbi:MAG: hypothetical protein LUE27_02305 [Clostridia bacterium]|nr:hypothetical protein [Clostridia bacterium]